MTQSNYLRKLVTSVSAAAILAGGSLFAGDYGKVVIDDKAPIEAWHFCDLFDLAKIYEADISSDPKNPTLLPFVTSVKLQGRYHGQYEHVDVDGPAFGGPANPNGARFTDYAQWEHRRIRIGAKVEFWDKYLLAFNLNMNGYSGAQAEGAFRGDAFDGIEDITISWDTDGPLGFVDSIKIGKFKNEITREEAISSNNIRTIERSHFVNSFNMNRPWGIEVSKEAFGMKHRFGVGTTSVYNERVAPNAFGNRVREDPRWFNLDDTASLWLTYQFEKEVGPGTLHFDYQYSNWSPAVFAGAVPQNALNKQYLGSSARNLFALGYVIEEANWGVLFDVMHANGIAAPGDLAPSTGGVAPAIGAGYRGRNSTGVVILPHYKITDKLEIVGRYHYASLVNDENPFDNTESVRPFSGFGGNNSDWLEDIHTFYLGLNYYICGNNLKVMGGVEYATGNSISNQVAGRPASYDATALVFAVRTKF